MTRKLLALCALLMSLSACGGGGGSGSSTASTASTAVPAPAPAPPALTNMATLVVDGGPASITTGANPVIEGNIVYVSVTLCAPGTSNCQTIDHVQVDTGSEGLRIAQSVLNPSLLAAMPTETDASANPVGECFQFVDGYTFGSVRQADFTVGGEQVSGLPLQVVGDTGAFANVPSQCSSAGGSNLDTVLALGANGIIGVGTTPTDCGAACQTPGGLSAAAYFDCPASGCAAIIARTSSTTAPFQQLPNPVAAFSVDNNGVIISLPAPGSGGASTLTGTIFFGIGTQANNALGSATPLTTTVDGSPTGSGLITATYKGQTLPDSFIDSGSSLYFFTDATIPLCTAQSAQGYYCPSSPLTISPTLQGQNGASKSAAFTLSNAQTLLATNFPALPNIGGDPQSLGLTNASPTSFDFGLPFFYGRNIYTAIEGRTAGGVAGPFYAY